MIKEFIPTPNYQRLEALHESLSETLLSIDLGVVIGPYGRGKTFAAEKLAAVKRHTPYICYQPLWSLTALIREISFKVAGTRPRNSDSCIETIKAALEEERWIFLIDEADQMPMKHLNQLRSFHDLYHVPIVLFGEGTLYNKMVRDGRFMSRIREVITFDPVQQADVIVFYRNNLDIALTPEQAARLVKHAEGDYRDVLFDGYQAKKIMEVSGIKRITDEVINKVISRPRRKKKSD